MCIHQKESTSMKITQKGIDYVTERPFIEVRRDFSTHQGQALFILDSLLNFAIPRLTERPSRSPLESIRKEVLSINLFFNPKRFPRLCLNVLNFLFLNLLVFNLGF